MGPFKDKRKYIYYRTGRLCNKQDIKIASVCYRKLKDSTVYVSRFVVVEEFAGKGLGTKIMKDFCKWLDSINAICYLTAMPLDHSMLTDAQLRRFYRKFGFHWNKADDEMIRRPSC